MLKDLTRKEWLDALALTAERVPSILILRGTRNLRRHYDRHRAYFDEVQAIGSPNALFEDIFIGRLNGATVGYASVYGPAMASEITHLFGVLGTGLVIQTGVCGALEEGIGAGELIIATHARCAEGAAECYLPGVDTVAATPELVEAVLADPGAAVARHAGPVWTTPALLAEGQAEIDHWHSEGYIAADMETATTFAVAEHFGMRRLSILSVFDNPREGAHLGLTESHKDGARAAGEHAMLTLLFNVIATHGRMDLAATQAKKSAP